MSKQISYNLPGFGFANCLLFGEVENLYDLLDKKGLIEKLRKTYQLGTMRFVYPGAHHTRYEYIFTQLMLISNVVTGKGARRNVELSLSSKLGEYKALGYKVSGGEILQMLAILGNLGHMYDTFTASRIFLRLLKESKEKGSSLYQVYKRNLPKEIYSAFDELLYSENYYKLHLFNAIHLIKGYSISAANKDICNLSVQVLTQLIDSTLIKNEATFRIFTLYKKLRKIAYLSVDMIYTPASFGANLSQMIYSISSAIDDLFNDQSAISRSIGQLEDIIHKQIYDSPICILNSTRIEQEYYLEYAEVTSQISNVFDLRKLICEEDGQFRNLHCDLQPDVMKRVHQDYTLLLSNNNMKERKGKVLNYDEKITKELPLTRIAFGTQLAQNLSCVYSAFGILKYDNILEDCQTIISKAIANNMYEKQQEIELVRYAVRSLYKVEEFYFTFSTPTGVRLDECVFIGNGCKNIAQQIRTKFLKEKVPNEDQLHEIMSCVNVLESMKYSGLVICFIGGIKANRYAKTERIDEIDGFIYFPNRNSTNTVAVIIEAKNYSHGETEAEKQLKDTQKYLSDSCEVDIKKAERCAYMEISFKKEKR